MTVWFPRSTGIVSAAITHGQSVMSSTSLKLESSREKFRRSNMSLIGQRREAMNEWKSKL
jgi:hypothetical protein